MNLGDNISTLIQPQTFAFDQKAKKGGSFVFGLNRVHTLHYYNFVGMPLGNVASFTSGIVLMAGRNPRDSLDKGKGKIEQDSPQPGGLFEKSEENQKGIVFGGPIQYKPEPLEQGGDFTGSSDPQLYPKVLDVAEGGATPSVASAATRIRRGFLTGPVGDGLPSETSRFSPNNQAVIAEADYEDPAGESFWNLEDNTVKKMKGMVNTLVGWAGAKMNVPSNPASLPLVLAADLAKETIALKKRTVQEMGASIKHDDQHTPVSDDIEIAGNPFIGAIPKIEVNIPKDLFPIEYEASGSSSAPRYTSLEQSADDSQLRHGSTEPAVVQTPQEFKEKETIIDSITIEINRVAPSLLPLSLKDKEPTTSSTSEAKPSLSEDIKPRTRSEPADPHIPEEPRELGRRQAKSEPADTRGLEEPTFVRPQTKTEPASLTKEEAKTRSSSAETVGTLDEMPTIPEVKPIPIVESSTSSSLVQPETSMSSQANVPEAGAPLEMAGTPEVSSVPIDESAISSPLIHAQTPSDVSSEIDSDVPIEVSRSWYQSCFPCFFNQRDDYNPSNPSGALGLASSSILRCIRDHDIDQIWDICVTHLQNLWACSFAFSINVLMRRGLPTLLKKFPEGSPFATQYPRFYRWLQNLCETVQKNGDTVMLAFSAYIAFSAYVLWGNVWSLVTIAKKMYDFYKKNKPNA